MWVFDVEQGVILEGRIVLYDLMRELNDGEWTWDGESSEALRRAASNNVERILRSAHKGCIACFRDGSCVVQPEYFMLKDMAGGKLTAEEFYAYATAIGEPDMTYMDACHEFANRENTTLGDPFCFEDCDTGD
jgi:hypothetical protein